MHAAIALHARPRKPDTSHARHACSRLPQSCVTRRTAPRAHAGGRRDRRFPAGYGSLVDDPHACKVEIVRWPAHGWRPVDEDSGDEGGTTQGRVRERVARRHPVRSQRGRRRPLRPRVRGRAFARGRVARARARSDDAVALQLPSGRRPAVLSARRAAVLRPARAARRRRAAREFVCFRFDGKRGLYIHPNIWHEGVFARRGTQRFFDSRARSMRACRSTSRASSAACCEARSLT